MASIKYIGKGIIRCNRKDHAASAVAGKRVDINKHVQVIGKDGKRIKSEYGNRSIINATIAKLQKEWDELEEQSKTAKCDQAPIDSDSPYLHLQLRYQADTQPCISTEPKSMARAAGYVRRFADWCEQHHDTLTVDTFERRHALAYVKSLKSYSKGSISTMISSLASCWELMTEMMQNPPANPFRKIGKKIVSDVEGSADTSAFSKDWIRDFAAHVKANRQDLYPYFFVLAVTGWRRSDVINLQVGNVNIKNRVLKVVHGKTKKKTGAKTLIHLTDNMVELLSPLVKDKKADDRLFGKVTANMVDYVFANYLASHRPDDYSEHVTNHRVWRSHSIHSFRRSVATHLKSAGYDSELVRYMTGHTGGSMEERHYNKFTVDVKGSTEGAVSYMERVVLGVTDAKEDIMAKLRAVGIDIEMLRTLLAS